MMRACTWDPIGMGPSCVVEPDWRSGGRNGKRSFGMRSRKAAANI